MYRVYAGSCSFNKDYTNGLHPNFELGIRNFELLSASPQILNYSVLN